MSRSTRVVRRWLPGGWSLLGERRGGFAQRDGIDHCGLVSLGPPGRYPSDVPRPLVDPVDARDHRPLAQAHASHVDPAFSLVMQAGPREGPDFPFSILNPIAKRCSMNDTSESPAVASGRPAWEGARDARV